MTPDDIAKLETPAYSSPLQPGVIRELGRDAQVWGMEMKIERGTARNHLVCVTLDNGTLALSIPFTAFVQGKRGIPLHEFSRAVYAALSASGVGITKKTRLLLYVYDSTPRYSVLDVYDLDKRIKFNPGGAGNFSLHFHDEESGQNLEIIDLQANFPDEPVERVMQKFGLTETHAYSKKIKRAAVDDEFFSAWAANGARVNFQIITAMRNKMLSEYGVDSAVYRTPASLSARIYVSKFLTKPVGAIKKPIRLLAMRAYWGGRMEAFTQGNVTGDLNLYDAVSMYPNAAIQLGEMPTEFSWFRLTPGNMEICKGGLCHVKFEFDPTEIHPCLPVYAAGRMYYPLKGESFCTVHEVRYALEIGCKLELIEGFGYVNGEKSLAAYSRDLLARKNAAEAAGDVSGRAMYKLLMNSLYGKFGQHRVEYDLNDLRDICRRTGWADLDTLMHIPNWQVVAGDMLNGGQGLPIKEKIRMGGQWSPEWAALIQGYARMVESRAMRDYVALYGTTDSILIDGDAGDEFEIAGIKFKREARGNKATIIRSRLYALECLDGKIKAALHGAPMLEEMPERILNWSGQEEIPVTVTKVKQLREGLTTGDRVGMGGPGTWRVNCRWDGKRLLSGNYSEPHEEVFTSPDAKAAQ